MEAGHVDTPRASSRPFLAAALLGSAALLLISFSPAVTVPKYRVAFWFLVPLVWAAYALRGRLAIHPVHYVLFVVGILLHDLGAFGWYSRSIGPLQYDWCVHGFFGVVGALMVARALAAHGPLRGGALALVSVLVVGGVGALHEIMEAASTMASPEMGMLYIGPDNPYDTQEDLLAAAIGSSVAALVRWACSREQSA
jgi:hypothetical protein